jgi:hypothetical protein
MRTSRSLSKSPQNGAGDLSRRPALEPGRGARSTKSQLFVNLIGKAGPIVVADSRQWVIKKTHLLVISHTVAGDGVAGFDHEAIHVGCSFRSSLLNGVEQQEDNNPQDRKNGHDHSASPSTFGNARRA